METATRVKDVIPDTGGEIDLDMNVRKGRSEVAFALEYQHRLYLSIVLPPGSRVISSVTYGTAVWTRAARVTVLLEGGTEKSYFLKV
jgi:hypothetical protein